MLNKKVISNWVKELKSAGRNPIIFAVAVLACSICIIIFLVYYFKPIQDPYMTQEVFDLSEDWQFQESDGVIESLDSLRTGPLLGSDETLTLYKTLDIELPDAALLIRTNHQAVRVYLDGTPLHEDKEYVPGENPGMALHFLLLPKDYLGKTLKVELTSPYSLYAGRTSPILMGSIPSLEAETLAQSMRSVILMAMCLLMGLCTIALTLVQALRGFVQPQNLALGIFTIVWALYYVCVEYIVFQFFTPVQMSLISLGLYFSMQAPLSLFFYFSFQHYKKWMLPAVVLHCGFVLVAFILQFFGIVDLPNLININNALLAGLAYTVVLTVLEARKGNRLMQLTAPFLMIAYGSMLCNFVVFYTRQGVVFYSYKDTFFLMILVILVYNVQQFISCYYHQQKEREILLLQNQMAKKSYEEVKTHLRQVGGLKHEMKHHLTAVQMYMSNGRYQEAQDYLTKYAEQSSLVTDVVHHEHYLVNALVVSLLEEAAKNGVKTELDLVASPHNIADPDLHSLLSNMQKNALEACTKIPEETERFIHLTIARRNPYLYITCMNSRQGEIISSNGKLQTTKSDPTEHGHGLQIIANIVKAYEGIMDADYDDATFTLSVALKDRE